jgi:alanyl-tRNA synthetase
MPSNDLRQKYLDFFKQKGHVITPSASLLPENDPTTLFTSSGMQPMVPFLLGAKHPLGTRICNSQRCFRTQDIDEVGDNRHTTSFEMLGNWSLGDYFKKEQITWMFEFLTDVLNLDPSRLFITVFGGKEEIGIGADDEAVSVWQSEFEKKGIEAKAVRDAKTNGMQDGRIFYYDETKNWWSRAGVTANMPKGEPGGPDSDKQIHEKSAFKDQPCHVNCDCGRFVEIGNNVFMQYIKAETGFEKLPQQNVDFGGGLERMTMAVGDSPDIFHIDLFQGAIGEMEKISGRKYNENSADDKAFRIIADHLKAATLLIFDGALPSNVDQGYFTRRLIRRAVRYARQLGINGAFAGNIASAYIDYYSMIYDIAPKKDQILSELIKEESKFAETLENGLREFDKLAQKNLLNGHEAFILFSSYGFPWEMTAELAAEKGIVISKDEFDAEFTKHQELSRAGAEQKFKGGLADSSVETCRLHTATHLLQAALRKILGEHVHQKGSNITVERLRFDFTHGEKMTAEQLKQAEDIVNDWIKQDIQVVCEELPYDEAVKRGAMGLFTDKYGQVVKVYTIAGASCEMCGGPHADDTGELGHFKIQKEEASSAGVRRIKAILE